MNLVISKCVTAVKVSNFTDHYLPNRSTLDIGVLGFFGIVWHKEHPPEVWSVPPVTSCIYISDNYIYIIIRFYFHLETERTSMWLTFRSRDVFYASSCFHQQMVVVVHIFFYCSYFWFVYTFYYIWYLWISELFAIFIFCLYFYVLGFACVDFYFLFV
jgi:hypothetical protein